MMIMMKICGKILYMLEECNYVQLPLHKSTILKSMYFILAFKYSVT